MSCKCSLLSTGNLFKETGVRSIEDVLLEMIYSARRRIDIVTYSISIRPQSFWENLQDALRRRVEVNLIVDSSTIKGPVSAYIPDRVRNLEGFNLYIYEAGPPLHAKLVLCDMTEAIIGSANITGGGIYENQEIAVYIRGEEMLTLRKLVDKLIDHCRNLAQNRT